MIQVYTHLHLCRCYRVCALCRHSPCMTYGRRVEHFWGCLRAMEVIFNQNQINNHHHVHCQMTFMSHRSQAVVFSIKSTHDMTSGYPRPHSIISLCLPLPIRPLIFPVVIIFSNASLPVTWPKNIVTFFLLSNKPGLPNYILHWSV